MSWAGLAAFCATKCATARILCNSLPIGFRPIVPTARPRNPTTVASVGVVAKRKDSRYEIGKRSGSWAKYRLNSGQELVIGGYIPGTHGVDAIVVGYY